MMILVIVAKASDFQAAVFSKMLRPLPEGSNQPIGRRIVAGDLLGRRYFWQDLAGQLFAEPNSPLVKAEDIPEAPGTNILCSYIATRASGEVLAVWPPDLLVLSIVI